MSFKAIVCLYAMCLTTVLSDWVEIPQQTSKSNKILRRPSQYITTRIPEISRNSNLKVKPIRKLNSDLIESDEKKSSNVTLVRKNSSNLNAEGNFGEDRNNVASKPNPIKNYAFENGDINRKVTYLTTKNEDEEDFSETTRKGHIEKVNGEKINKPHKVLKYFETNDKINDKDIVTEATLSNSTSERTPLNKTIDERVQSIENIVKILKQIQKTLTGISNKGLNGKFNYLLGLKNHILDNIEKRINGLWPDDESRIRRSSKGHVDFPSSEGALMTISFLTFAVFLIKLVMQIIHTYKSKAMMVTPVITAMGKHFKRRHLDGEL